MGAVEQSSGEIESYLSTLEESYGSFSINQRTVTISPEQYEQERAKDDAVAVHLKVRNESGDVLHVEDGGSPALPSTTVSMDESLEPPAKAVVTEETGVSCRIEELSAVTILGLHDEANPESETLYRLAVLFEATLENDPGDGQAVWKDHDPESSSLLA